MLQNKFILIGLFLLIVALGFIIFGTQNSGSSKVLFNVSRLLALLSVAGVWYFGNIITKNTSLEIEQNKSKTAEAVEKTMEMEVKVETAKKETADALKKTKEIEIDLIEARKETEVAKHKTEELKLAVERAKLEAEKAKQERIKLQEKAKMLEDKDKKLTKKHRLISSFKIKIKILVPTVDLKTGPKNSAQGMMVSTQAPAKFNMKDGISEFTFIRDPETYWQQVQPRLMEIGMSFSPNPSNSIIPNDITFLELVSSFEIYIQAMLTLITGGDTSRFKLEETGNIIIQLDINGNSFESDPFSGKTNDIVGQNKAVMVFVNDFFKLVVKEYLENLGDK